MSAVIPGASVSWRQPARITAIRRGAPLRLAVVRPARPPCMVMGIVWTLLGMLVGGCAGQPARDPGKAELLRQIREAYLFDVNVAGLELLSVPEIVARLDPDTHLVEVRRRTSPDFIRGFEPEGSVMA